MDYQTLTVTITDRIGHVTLNRPDLRNAFNEQSIAELALAFDELGRHELVREIAGAPVTEALLEDTAGRIAEIRASLEGREGVASFLEKRRPSWLD
jgi:enoyl-CoA hydratase/carnithine racemase